ncbi:MAG: Rieske 2Fe-2S domain-containing protein [Hyphomonadaceae bacterium]|nr:Rieske 2Fe-2S domain-containing protein [Hyphomonadaceae bacterium]
MRNTDRRPAPPSIREIRDGAWRESEDGAWRPGAPHIRNAWHLACFAHELDAGILARTLLDEPVVLFRRGDGRVAALEDRCPHVGAPLSRGKLVGANIQCGYHGLAFDADGRCVEIPGQEIIPPAACVHAYPIEVRAEHVWIWMGDPQLAASHAVPDFGGDDDFFRWPRHQGVIPMRCNYSLMIQNLMDLTHLAYVHADSIGGDAADHATDEVSVSRTETGMRFVRTMRNVAPPGRYVARFGSAERLDRWSEFEFVAPAVVRQNSGWGRVGTGVIEERGGDLKDKMLHAITPSTASSSFYFYDGADGAEPDPARAKQRLSVLDKIIQEDVDMVEAQQARLEGVDPRTLIAVRSDKARLLMMKELQRRVEAQAGD